MTRLSTRTLFTLACVACCGCASPLREVMLRVTTDMDCTVIDRIEIDVARGTPDNVTYRQVFVRSECNVATDTSLPRADLSDQRILQLGVQDSHDSTEPLYVQLKGYLGPMLTLSTSAETTFVDNAVYGLPLALDMACVPVVCTPDSTCRVDADTGDTVCAQIFRTPGSDGLTPASGTDGAPPTDATSTD